MIVNQVKLKLRQSKHTHDQDLLVYTMRTQSLFHVIDMDMDTSYIMSLRRARLHANGRSHLPYTNGLSMAKRVSKRLILQTKNPSDERVHEHPTPNSRMRAGPVIPEAYKSAQLLNMTVLRRG
ncbi:hypothetical protein AMTR_s00142p00030020 [Amborella trichopoda]|uniref:Uncharacterized protein n=1 Tax=Amborella trichopoda TaxID=13333 RepID=W1PEG0_AMBTC|nr:hypothetical protein AMTR_s00142p00030020 [Amborella trichopoda]